MLQKAQGIMFYMRCVCVNRGISVMISPSPRQTNSASPRTELRCLLPSPHQVSTRQFKKLKPEYSEILQAILLRIPKCEIGLRVLFLSPKHLKNIDISTIKKQWKPALLGVQITKIITVMKSYYILIVLEKTSRNTSKTSEEQ